MQNSRDRLRINVEFYATSSALVDRSVAIFSMPFVYVRCMGRTKRQRRFVGICGQWLSHGNTIIQIAGFG